MDQEGLSSNKLGIFNTVYTTIAVLGTYYKLNKEIETDRTEITNIKKQITQLESAINKLAYLDGEKGKEFKNVFDKLKDIETDTDTMISALDVIAETDGNVEEIIQKIRPEEKKNKKSKKRGFSKREDQTPLLDPLSDSLN